MTAGPGAPATWNGRAISFKLGTGHDLPAELEATEPRLRGLVLLAAGVSLAVYELPLIVGHVHRTSAEQATLYEYLQRRGIPVPESPHQADPSRAVDCRVLHATNPRAYGQGMADLLNRLVVYGPSASKFSCALYEEPPLVNAPHLHLQVPPVTVRPVPAPLVA